MKIAGPWLDARGTQTVCAMLTGAGYQALFVGGCVRDALLDVPVRDIDIATDARPDTVLRLGEQAGLSVAPTGIDHGTVTVVADGTPFEITTFRKDIETDGRRAVVAFADDAATDARRRDFTMNALYARPDGTLVDPLGGVPDALARRVRFIDDAGARIREDYLRILRFFRFSAWYGDPDDGMDAETLAAIAVHLDGIDQLAPERITAELTKLLGAPDPMLSLGAMDQTGALPRILPGAHVPSLAVYRHLAALNGQMPTLPGQLAALRAPDGEAHLRLDRKTAKAWRLIRELAEGPMRAAEMGYRHGPALAVDAALVRGALLGHVEEGFGAAIARAAMQQLPVRPADLMPRYEGAALGEKLRQIEARWIASDFTLDRDALLS